MAEPDWSLYRTFLAVLRDGSLSGAARRLGLAQPTVGGCLAKQKLKFWFNRER